MSSAEHQITLITGDGENFVFSCAEDETLTVAAGRAGLSVPSVCGQGACGACQGTCEDGDYDLASHSAQALPDALRQQGGILLCRTQPRGALKVSLSAIAAQITAGPPPERLCTVAEVTAQGGGVYLLALDIIPDPEDGIGPLFEPGQFMELQIPETDVWRAYSLANAPNWDGRLEFLIRLQPQGQFSRWLETEAKPGQQILSRGGQGAFAVRQGSLNRRLMVAGGTGLAPFLSILRQMVEFGEDQPTHLIFGVNQQSDLFALELLDDLKAALPSLSVEVCVWKPVEGWAGAVGTPADRLAACLQGQEGAGHDLYICGPAPLIDAAEAVAAQAGIPAVQVVAERFLPPA
jgi:methane monooxygenase component C